MYKININMKFLKKYESFDISQIYDEIKNIKEIELDPFDEEDWDELDEGDMIYHLNIRGINKRKAMNLDKIEDRTDG